MAKRLESGCYIWRNAIIPADNLNNFIKILLVNHLLTKFIYSNKSCGLLYTLNVRHVNFHLYGQQSQNWSIIRDWCSFVNYLKSNCVKFSLKISKHTALQPLSSKNWCCSRLHDVLSLQYSWLSISKADQLHSNTFCRCFPNRSKELSQQSLIFIANYHFLFTCVFESSAILQAAHIYLVRNISVPFFFELHGQLWTGGVWILARNQRWALGVWTATYKIYTSGEYPNIPGNLENRTAVVLSKARA